MFFCLQDTFVILLVSGIILNFIRKQLNLYLVPRNLFIDGFKNFIPLEKGGTRKNV
jgi:hypothetical protein